MKDTPIVMAADFDISLLGKVKRARIQRGHKYPTDRHTGKKIHYADLICAFDIENSVIETDEGPQGVMYIWQMQIGNRLTLFGRTWEEFLEVVQKLNAWLEPLGWNLPVFVHNLSYEFQYLSGIWHFNPEDVFATDDRDVLHCMMGRLEFRCSARLAGQGLGSWASDLKVDHQKLPDFQYTQVRYPWTPLTDDEYRYCFNDVLGVVECVEKTMHTYGDTIYTLPWTRTGFVRRVARQSMRMWSPSAIRGMQNDLVTYDRLRNAFRGGDTHANPYHVHSILGEVNSYDRSSSYPDVMCHCRFPMTRFREEEATWESFKHLCESGRAVLAKVCFFRIRLVHKGIGNPYISYDWCNRAGYTRPIGDVCDNGRIRSADFCEMTLTEIDYRIIEDQYDWDSIRILWVMSARYGNLPQPLIDLAIHLYERKTSLKNVEGKEMQYVFAKADLNSLYGMMCQRVISQPIVYRADDIDQWGKGDIDREEEYAKAIDKAFLNYAWAVWVTAWARWRLFEGVKIATRDDLLNFVYADTDSIKTTHPVNLDQYNQARIRDAKASGAYATDPKGNVHYMGVFEYEGQYDLFVTLGAKRYCVKQGDDIIITVAGVPKTAGSAELVRRGGIESFTNRFVFQDCNKLHAMYNDHVDFWIEVDGIPLHITQNVYLSPATYDMTLEQNYAILVATLQDQLDQINFTDYNAKR